MLNALLSRIGSSGLKFLWISLVVIGVDQWSKQLVLKGMALSESYQLLPFFNLTYVRNYGAAFSFLHDADGWQRWFFTLIAVGISGVILWWLAQTKSEQPILPIAFTFVLGGALGNVYDRIAYGYVVDFLDVYVGSYHWPVFNIADSAIFVGAMLIILDMFINKKDTAENNEKSTDE